ncbi:MAG: carbon monoxide dehydrogenase subunit G [Rhodoferax sp.]|nr:carbon monoxide dehydrogenase subunit G [Rhodoferax sp.]
MAMEFSGEYRIPARQQQVWDALNDPAVLQACIVGCKQLEKLSDTELFATVVTTVGPISATFKGNVVLSDLDAPNGYTLTGQGQGGAAGFAKMAAKVALSEAQNETVLKYVASAEIGGKLASVGSRLVQTVAKKNADDFFAAFARQLGGTGMKEATVSTPATAPAMPLPGAIMPGAAAPARLFSSLGAPVPAWLVVFACGLGIALGYCFARLP